MGQESIDDPLIYIIAGEASGDLLGADLMLALRERFPEASFAGIGGAHMQAQGLASLFPMDELSIMGLWGILKNLIPLRRRLRETIQDICEKKPRYLITIDAPEFSLRVARALRRQRDRGELDFSIQLIHEVAPTVWAWRPGRTKTMATIYDHLLCLYPMEPSLFEKEGLPSTFIGHPVTEDPLGNQDAFFKMTDLTPEKPLLCVLPGSRRSEITTLLPVFEEVVARLQKSLPDLQVVIPTLPKVRSLVEQGVADWPLVPTIVEGEDARRNAFAASRAALAASGTIALQLAHAGVPFVIAYRIGSISAAIARCLLTTPWACMINILGAREIIPEYIQDCCEPEKIAEGLLPLMSTDAAPREAQLLASREVMATLKRPAPLSMLLENVLKPR